MKLATAIAVTATLALALMPARAGAAPPGDTAAPGTAVTGRDAAAAGGVRPAAAICDKYCDARDPALAAGDRTVVTASVWSRAIVLHADDSDDMMWASIDNGDPGDEVWLDRSFDGGRTWSSGSKLGDTSVPDGSRGWRTLMYNADDWNNRGIGALRACGRADDRPEIACTGWARTTWNAADRRRAAATALMAFYDNGTGLFDTTGWWNSANALTAVIDNIRASGMPSYQYAIATTYDKNIGAGGGNFTNDYIDDTGWWGLAWVDAYDLTGDPRYLDTARADADYMARYWDSTCGGGVWWSTAKSYKNAIPNELYLWLTAALHNRIPGDTHYLQQARAEWDWFSGTGMINGSNLVNDGLTDSCAPTGATYTYNQGMVLGGLTELYQATGDTAYLDSARRLADASTTDRGLNPDGILADPGEPGSDGGGDGPSFKGAYVRGLGALNAALSGHPYSSYLSRQAESNYAHNRNSFDQYGYHWAGPLDKTDAARQQSVVDLLNLTG